MKCVLIVYNPIMPEIVFMWSDTEFKRHIAKTAMKRGLIEVIYYLFLKLMAIEPSIQPSRDKL